MGKTPPRVGVCLISCEDVRVLASQRQERILVAVRAHGAARVADLVESLDVSDMTVRRDIAELARAGLVRRVHGGAVAPDALGRPTDEPGFEAKRSSVGLPGASGATAPPCTRRTSPARASSAMSRRTVMSETSRLSTRSATRAAPCARTDARMRSWRCEASIRTSSHEIEQEQTVIGRCLG